MMEQDYTTRSAPEHVGGWQSLMIGDQLWHSMWVDDHVTTAAASICGAMSPAYVSSADAD